MSTSRTVFLFVSAVLALLGLFAAATAESPHLSIFAFGLMLFGVLFGLGCVKRHFDEAEADARRH